MPSLLCPGASPPLCLPAASTYASTQHLASGLTTVFFLSYPRLCPESERRPDGAGTLEALWIQGLEERLAVSWATWTGILSAGSSTTCTLLLSVPLFFTIVVIINCGCGCMKDWFMGVRIPCCVDSDFCCLLSKLFLHGILSSELGVWGPSRPGVC